MLACSGNAVGTNDLAAGGHSLRRLIAAIGCSIVLMAASCGKGVDKAVTLTFSNDRPDVVTISASTELGNAEPGTPEAAAIEREREAILSGSDDWSVRFTAADPELERVTVQRERKQLQRLEHMGVIPVANLQRFFFDTNLILDVVNGGAWRELTIHAGTSNRATRQQRDHVDRLLTNFSGQAVRYFAATHALYDYLDSNDGRAEAVFFSLAGSLANKDKKPDEEPPPALNDAEDKLVKSVVESIEAMLDDDKGGSGNLDREFDAAFNPFPAELHIVVPGEPLAVEGFSRQKDGGIMVKSTGVIDALGKLEGKWVSPDLIAGLIRAGEGADMPRAFAAAMAKAPRHAEDVVPTDEVRQALIGAMKPPERYSVRWSAINKR